MPSWMACNQRRASRAAAFRRIRGIFISWETVRGFDFATAIRVRSFRSLPGGKSRDLANFSRVVHNDRTIAKVLRSRISWIPDVFRHGSLRGGFIGLVRSD